MLRIRGITQVLLMAEPVVHVLVTASAKPERLEELQGMMEALIDTTRSSPGCLRSDLMVRTDDPLEFVIVQTWQDLEAHRAHLAMDARSASGGTSADLELRKIRR